MLKRGLRYVDELSGAVRSQLALAYRAKDLIAYGLRGTLREHYTRADFRADLRASLTTGAVAFPLCLALAIACGVSPQHGLYSAIIAGTLTALLGGTRTQITGPTAAFVVILLPIVHQHGLPGLLVAGGMAGIILAGMGLARFGRFLQLIPHPVTAGLTAGIALALAVYQLPAILGIRVPTSETLVGTVQSLWAARGGVQLADVAVAVAAIAILMTLPRVAGRWPAPLVAIVVIAVGVVIVHRFVPGFSVATIGSRFTWRSGGQDIAGFPPLPPLPVIPWRQGAGLALDYHTIRELLPSAFAIAMLGSIESLNTAIVAEGMSGKPHDPNSELIALGIANVVTPFFGGIAATGALARTTRNIRAGARSPIAAVLQCVLLLAGMLALAPLVAYVPLAALAGLLVVVAYNLSEGRHFLRLARIAPRSDVTVMLTCFTLTVVFDMVIAVTVGIVLAALLFMRRMAVLTRATLRTETEGHHAVPEGVRVYELAGPLFFGAAKTAMEALHTAGGTDHTVILAMQHVPTIDATGLVAVESTLDRLYRSKIRVILAGVTPEVAEIFERAGIKREPGRLAYAPDVDTAIAMAGVGADRELQAA